jgi:hypothetical protein
MNIPHPKPFSQEKVRMRAYRYRSYKLKINNNSTIHSIIGC